MARQQEPSATLDDVVHRLDTLIAVIMPSAGESGDVVSRLAADILRLCDYEHETNDIRKAVGKSLSHVNKELSLLRKRGLITTVSRGSRQVHVRIRGA